MKAYTIRWEPRALRELEEAQEHTGAGHVVVLDEELDGAEKTLSENPEIGPRADAEQAPPHLAVARPASEPLPALLPGESQAEARRDRGPLAQPATPPEAVASAINHAPVAFDALATVGVFGARKTAPRVGHAPPQDSLALPVLP